MNDEGKYLEYWLAFSGNGSQNMLSILKKVKFDIKSDRLPSPFQYVYLSSKKLSKFWDFVAPWALTCVSRNSKQFCNLVLDVNYSE